MPSTAKKRPVREYRQHLPIEVYDVRHDASNCDYCDTKAEVMVLMGIVGITPNAAAFWLCAKHRISLESGLRAARKFFVRGGKLAP